MRMPLLAEVEVVAEPYNLHLETSNARTTTAPILETITPHRTAREVDERIELHHEEEEEAQAEVAVVK